MALSHGGQRALRFQANHERLGAMYQIFERVTMWQFNELFLKGGPMVPLWNRGALLCDRDEPMRHGV